MFTNFVFFACPDEGSMEEETSEPGEKRRKKKEDEAQKERRTGKKTTVPELKRKKETKKKSKEGKKSKKAKRVSSPSTSETESTDESETSPSSSESISESSSSEDEPERKRKKKKARSKNVTWDLINEMWPINERPAQLQNKKIVQRMEVGDVLEIKRCMEEEGKKSGMGTAVFGRDMKAKKIRYKQMTDDGVKRLHPARCSRLPLAPPKKYWKMMPKKRDEVHKHFPMEHYGVDGQVAATTITRMHDRQVELDMEMFSKSLRDKNSVMALQLAIVNFGALSQCIWPLDYSPWVLLRVLAENRWGATVADDEKTKADMVRLFFNEVCRENAGKAVREEPPLSYEQC